MVKKQKLYYIIEQLDIDGDKNPDGFLISQYKLDKHFNKIFIKNKYVTFEFAKKKIQNFQSSNKIGGTYSTKKNIKHPQYYQHPQHPQYPQYPQNPQYPQYPQYPQHPQHPQHPQNPQYPQHPNGYYVMSQDEYNMYMNKHQPIYPQHQIIIRDTTNNNSFTNSLFSGLGLGVGFGLGEGLMDALI